MRPSRQQPYFRTPLFPTFTDHQGRRVGRFLLRTQWQVRRLSDPDRVEGVPRSFSALLAADEQFFSVLPYTFQHHFRIWTEPLPGAAPPWQNIPVRSAVHVWLPDAEENTTQALSLLVLCPERPGEQEPAYPLIGHEFFRHYEPVVRLDYPSFPWDPDTPLNRQCGWLEW